MKRLISFSLWGNSPKYCVGAIKNAQLALEIYPEWVCRFYCHKNVPKEIINSLLEYKNTEVFILDREEDWRFAATRFLAISDFYYDYIIFRDTDSRLSARESSAVEEWIKSNKTLHIMKDHPGHCAFPIFAGMFGIKGKTISNIDESLNNFNQPPSYNYDQNFLQKIIFPLFKDDCVTHDEIFEKKPFPLNRNGYEFVGQVFDENDNRNLDHEAGLINYLS